jgi:hypothetical protein
MGRDGRQTELGGEKGTELEGTNNLPPKLRHQGRGEEGGGARRRGDGSDWLVEGEGLFGENGGGRMPPPAAPFIRPKICGSAAGLWALGETGRLINDFLTPRARTGAATAVIIPAFGVRLCGGSFGMAQRRRRPLRRGISEGVVIRVLGGV